MRQLIAGNWKMNGTSDALGEVAQLVRWTGQNPPAADILLCPPATLISRMAALSEGRIALGGQDCALEMSGAYTGDISAEMLKDAGATAVILGHSERRQYHGESDDTVAGKVRAAWRAGLLAIVCVGESAGERKAGLAQEIVARQMRQGIPQGDAAARTAIAYEPVWAIGSGHTPTSGEIVQMHAFIRGNLADLATRILYGGSVKPENAKEILTLDGVDGALVGGASLKAKDFERIVAAADRRS